MKIWTILKMFLFIFPNTLIFCSTNVCTTRKTKALLVLHSVSHSVTLLWTYGQLKKIFHNFFIKLIIFFSVKSRLFTLNLIMIPLTFSFINLLSIFYLLSLHIIWVQIFFSSLLYSNAFCISKLVNKKRQSVCIDQL